MATAIVVDANVAVRAVVDRQASALDAFDAWNEAGTELLAPDLWLPEVVSALRRSMVRDRRSLALTEISLDALLGLPVRLLSTDRQLAIAALRWAERLGQAKAYDALYLALAERLGIPLVTADDRLLSRCRQLGIDFVEGLPEDAAG